MNERGRILLDNLIALGIASLAIAALVTLFTNISHTALRISQAHQGIIASTKAYAAISAALRTRERNRLFFAATVSSGPQFLVQNGGEHPLKGLTGATRPREASDILSLVDVAFRYRGRILEAKSSGSHITAKICGLPSNPSTNDFKSYLLYSIDAVHQVTGTIASISQSCVEFSGSAVFGLVTTERGVPASPQVFVPVEREYSLFVDTTGTFRIASHIGSRITENQPIAQGLEAVRIAEVPHGQGVSTFALTITPNGGRDLRAFVTPALARRYLWNEVLP